MTQNNLSDSDIKSIVAAVVSELSKSSDNKASNDEDKGNGIKQFDFARHPGVQQSGSNSNRQPTNTHSGKDDSLPDLGDDSVGRIIGVPNPKNPDVLDDFVASSRSRVASGRAGARPRTMPLLRFWADHSRSKDTVLKNVSQEWVDNSGLLELHTEIIDKDQFLTRPDLGRRLSADSVEVLNKECI